MIEASVMRTVWNDGKTGYEVKAKGHAGAGKYGQDIVCAAVSCLLLCSDKYVGITCQIKSDNDE